MFPTFRDKGTEVSSMSCFLGGKVILSRDVLGQRSFPWNFCSCPCSWTKGQQDKEIFLSRDKGTMGRSVPDCPGTSRPLGTLITTTECLIFFETDVSSENVILETLFLSLVIYRITKDLYVNSLYCK